MIVGVALLMDIPTGYSVMGYGLLPSLFFLVAIALGLYVIYGIMFKDENVRKK